MGLTARFGIGKGLWCRSFRRSMTTMSARRVAITGSSGHLGRVVVGRLLAQGEVDEVVALDRVAPDPAAVAWARDPRVRPVVADVRDPDLARHVAGCQAVMHLAFIVESGSRDEALVQAVNVEGTKNVVRAAIDAGAEQIVYASSIASYGFHAENVGRVLDESAPVRGNEDFYYTRTKAEVERWCEEVAAAHPQVALARLRPSLFLDPDSPRAALLRAPAMVQLGRGGGVPVHVTHQDDVADAFVLALRRRARGAFNVATEEPLPVSRFGEATGKRTIVVPEVGLRALRALYRRGVIDIDPAWFECTGTYPIAVSSERARRELGWRPRWPTTGAALRAIVGRPTACASPATRLALGAAALASRLPGGLPASATVRNESRSISGALNLVLEGERPSEWHLDLEGGRARVVPGLRADARAGVRMRDETFHELIAGALTWTTAQMTGRVRFHGPGEFAFLPGMLAERFRDLGRGEGLRGAPGRAFAGWIARRAGRTGPAAPASPGPDASAAAGANGGVR